MTSRGLTPLAPGADTGHMVLVVEDELSLRKLFERALQRHGYHVLLAGDATEALAVAARIPAVPLDVLVADVVLPGTNGVELARALRVDRPDLRVIHVSGFPIDSHRLSCDSRTLFLMKPFTADALVQAIRQSLAPHP